jgi:hypothetical protein
MEVEMNMVTYSISGKFKTRKIPRRDDTARFEGKEMNDSRSSSQLVEIRAHLTRQYLKSSLTTPFKTV